MRRTTGDLLNEYRHANFNKRLHLYLQYRELRPDFMELNQYEPIPKTAKGRDSFRWLPRLFTCCSEKA